MKKYKVSPNEQLVIITSVVMKEIRLPTAANALETNNASTAHLFFYKSFISSWEENDFKIVNYFGVV